MFRPSFQNLPVNINPEHTKDISHCYLLTPATGTGGSLS